MSGFSALSQASGGSAMKIPQCESPILTMKSDKSVRDGVKEQRSSYVLFNIKQVIKLMYTPHSNNSLVGSLSINLVKA